MLKPAAARFSTCLCALFSLILFAAFTVEPVEASSSGLVISQVYGGGGNSGAPYKNDFIEIFNGGTAAVSLSGLSLQYASATGTGNFGVTNQITLLPNVMLNPGQ